MIMGLLEASAQRSPEILNFSSSHVTIAYHGDAADITILKGKHSEQYTQGEHRSIIGRSIEKGQGTITFKPLVPFNYDKPYTVIYGSTILYFTVEQAKDRSAIEVVGIYPNNRQVPANILKWYVRFSQPVNPVKIYDHIHFLDQEGNPIDRSILNLKAPLLSADGTLLTIWIEPGRQKQLLGPNARLGSVFEPHQHYTLHIDGAIKDINGIEMGTSVRHQFIIADTDRVKPTIDDWDVGELQAHTLEPLEIALPEPVDYGSLIDAFGLYYEGDIVAGSLKYDSNGSSMSFHPEEPWQVGAYTVRIMQHLEDLAGNNLRHLFDRPITKELPEEPREFALEIICE